LADVRPFRGVTYDPSRVSLDRVLCPPYDVISPHQQEAYYARDERNAVRVVLNRAAGEERYSDAARALQAWLDDGSLKRPGEPALYVHRHTFTAPDGRRLARAGILAAVRLEPWAAGVVKPHEHTMPGPKLDRLQLLRATHTDTEPIWLFHPDPEDRVAMALADLTALHAADLDAEFAPADGPEAGPTERHELWRVDGADWLQVLTPVLATLPLYIADGHHRYETALTYAEESGGPRDAATRFKLVLLTAMRDPGLLVLPTHRLLRLPPGESLGRLLADLRVAGWRTEQPRQLADLLARLAEPAAPGQVGFGLFAERRYSYLEGPATTNAASIPLAPVMEALDVAVIHQRVLAPCLGVTAERLAAGDTVQYSRDPAEVRRRVAAGEFDAGIFLRAPTLRQIRDVADAGESMPQKSTYFWPKPASGLMFMPQPPGEPL